MNALTPLRFSALLILLEIAYTLISIARAPNWGAFLIGDCPYYAATAESLVHEGDWDLRNQLPGDLKDHEGFFALSKDHRVVPKHSTLLPIVSIPFYLLMGKAGFLVFNLVQIFLLIWGITQLAGNNPAARLLSLAGYLSTPFLAYTFNYSPDVLGTVLVVWSFVFGMRERPLLCGLLAGLAIWAKIYLAIVLLPLAIIILPRGWRPTLRCALAAVVAVLPMLVINAHLFGSPSITGYDRDARITPDGFTVTEHYSRFNQPLLAGLGNLFFDERIGMLCTAPLWFLWPIGAVVACRSRCWPRSQTVAISLAIVLNLLIFATYDEWSASAFGNRFLFPALALGLAVQSPIWEKILARRKDRVAPPLKAV